MTENEVLIVSLDEADSAELELLSDVIRAILGQTNYEVVSALIVKEKQCEK